jgi:predicted DNA-binding transcriptional regulator AlpA
MPKPQNTSTPLRKTRRTPPPVNIAGRLGVSQVELAALTGKSASYWRRLAKLGLGPRAIRAGGRGLIFPVSAVREWLDRNAIDPADVAGR